MQFWFGAVGNPYDGEVGTFFSDELTICTLMGLMDRRLASICDEMGIQHLDLRSAVEPNVENFYDQIHFTPQGAAIVASKVAEAILEGMSAGNGPGSAR